MLSEIKKYIENLIRNAASSEEVFDSFSQAIRHRIKDLDLYKMILASAHLSEDEIIMFTEKLCTEFEDLAFDIYMWTAHILESTARSGGAENAFNYYKKACEADKTRHEPFVSILRLYNPDADIPSKENILSWVSSRSREVMKKSVLYREMGLFFNSLGDEDLKRKYLALSARHARNGQ